MIEVCLDYFVVRFGVVGLLFDLKRFDEVFGEVEIVFKEF